MSQTTIPSSLKMVSIGAGYVGGPTFAVFAKYCPEHRFIVYDLNQRLIDKWNSDTMPIYELDLEPLVLEHRNKNLF